MTAAPVALGIVGAGIMGERMLAALQEGRGEGRGEGDGGPVAACGLWDPSPAALARVAARFPSLRVLPDAEAVIGESDCVYVASPPASHLGHARAALAAGRPVFCEKPLAVDVAEARAFVAQARGRGAVKFPFASSPGVAALAAWIGAGAVGPRPRLRIEVAFAAWPRPWQADAAGWLDRRAEGGFTREVVSHFLFLARRLVGPLALVEAEAEYPADGRAERGIAARLTAGGVPVDLVGRVGGTERDDANLWQLAGEAGAVRLRDWSIAERRGPEGEFVPEQDAMPNDRARMVSLRRQLDGVARLARGASHHLATLEEALEVQEAVEAILASG